MNTLRHYVHPSIVSSRRPIDIALIGAGGTGSQVLSGLARMNQALKALGSPGVRVRVFDGDSVSLSNVGRQLFSPSDIGKNKAVVLVTRFNMFFGTSWEAYTYDVSKGLRLPGGIIISAVDNVEAKILRQGHREKQRGRLLGRYRKYNKHRSGGTRDAQQSCPAKKGLPRIPAPCSRSLPGDYGGGVSQALPRPKLFAPGISSKTGPLRQPVGGHLRAGNHLEDVQIWDGKGARRLHQPRQHERETSSCQSGRVGIDGVEAPETEEER